LDQSEQSVPEGCSPLPISTDPLRVTTGHAISSIAAGDRGIGLYASFSFPPQRAQNLLVDVGAS
jgi:hypothetical protein